MARPATNDAWLSDSGAAMEAEGYQWPAPSLEDPIPDPLTYEDWTAFGGLVYERNGGIVRRRVQVYEDDTRLVRFVRCRARQAVRAGWVLDSPWWITEDWFMVLLSRARSGGNLRRAVRANLALPREWNACEAVVFARPRPGIRLAAMIGVGRMAAGSGEKDVYRVAPEAPHTWIEQCYIPGLGRMPWLGVKRPPSSAAAWLAIETATDIAAFGLNGR